MGALPLAVLGGGRAAEGETGGSGGTGGGVFGLVASSRRLLELGASVQDGGVEASRIPACFPEHATDPVLHASARRGPGGLLCTRGVAVAAGPQADPRASCGRTQGLGVGVFLIGAVLQVVLIVVQGRGPTLDIAIDDDEPGQLCVRGEVVAQLGEGGVLVWGGAGSQLVDVLAQVDVVDLVADVGVGLVFDGEVVGVVLLDEAQGGQAGDDVGPLLAEVGGQTGVCGGGHEPFRGYIVEVLQDGVNAHLRARPAEAVHQPGGHCGGATSMAAGCFSGYARRRSRTWWTGRCRAGARRAPWWRERRGGWEPRTMAAVGCSVGCSSDGSSRSSPGPDTADSCPPRLTRYPARPGLTAALPATLHASHGTHHTDAAMPLHLLGKKVALPRRCCTAPAH